MSVVTFWSNGREETGKTLSLAAISTYIAIEHNYKILVIATGFQDKTLSNCFWKENKVIKKSLGLSKTNNSTIMGEGIEGLATMAKSNKVSPENITNYTKVIFKDHLEILPGFQGEREKYEDLKNKYAEVISIANQYYDLVFVDLDSQIGSDIESTILQNSNLIVVTLNQRLTRIDKFIQTREKVPILKSMKTLLMIGRYDRYSKYSIKNLSRYMKEKNRVSTIPYNTLFFEACEEAKVPDLFLSFRKINEEERNGFFLAEVRRTSENIIYRLQDLQMRI